MQLQEQLLKLNQQKLINRYDYLGILGTYQTISKDIYQPIVCKDIRFF